MSVFGRWFDRLLRRRSEIRASDQGRSPPEARSALDASSPERALSELKAARNTSRERELLEAVQALHARGRASDELLLEAALAFAERGEEQAALELCGRLVAPGARLLTADLYARRGALRTALGHVERLLADDFDYPGALERQRRWAEQSDARVTTREQDATLLGSAPALADFAILREVSRGGSATVYEAADAALERRVALKVYHRAVAEHDRLLREAQLGVRFAGSGVVRVYDARPAHGVIVLEWVAGGSLKQRIETADRDWLWPIESWLMPLIDALGRVHDARFVHADIKPANVLLRRPGEPVLADFGLAAAADTPPFGGSLGYMPPDRDPAAGLRPDADVYALGRVLTEVVEALDVSCPDLRPDLAPWAILAHTATGSGRPGHARALRGARA